MTLSVCVCVSSQSWNSTGVVVRTLHAQLAMSEQLCNSSNICVCVCVCVCARCVVELFCVNCQVVHVSQESVWECECVFVGGSMH